MYFACLAAPAVNSSEATSFDEGYVKILTTFYSQKIQSMSFWFEYLNSSDSPETLLSSTNEDY